MVHGVLTVRVWLHVLWLQDLFCTMMDGYGAAGSMWHPHHAFYGPAGAMWHPQQAFYDPAGALQGDWPPAAFK